MNAERLLAEYERIADAPNAVARLRGFVLDLAVRGKLVAQDERDEPPTRVLRAARQRIQNAAEQTGRLRWQPSKPVDQAECSVQVPSGWVAARINDTGLYINGLAFKPSDWKPAGLPIIRIQNLTDPKREFNYATGTFPPEVMVEQGDILVSWSATLDAYKWERGRGVLNQHIFRVIRDHELTHVDFLLLVLRHAIRALATGDHARGLVMTHINRGPFLNHVIAVPPMTEQRRIVAKVDELMALCDRLEEARKGREAARDRLAAASLARLNTPDPETFQDDARFALNALPALTTRPDQLKQLRQTILNLAVSGRLVPQNVNEEPAHALLKRLHEMRIGAELIRRSRQEKMLTPGQEAADTDIDVPPSWAHARLVELGRTQTGTSPSSANPDLFGDFIPFIKPGDLDGPEINYEGLGLSEMGMGHSRVAPPNTVLMVCIGATLGKVNTTKRRVCFNQQINSLSPFLDELAPFIALALKASRFQSLAWSKAGTGTLPIISKGKWEQLAVPLPPLAEQRRIVAKVNKLMALCDRLEASLNDTEATRRRLLDALLAEALAPAEALKRDAA